MKLNNELLSMTDELSNEEAGMLFKAIADYQIRGETPNDKLIKVLFSPFKFAIDSERKHSEDVSEKRKVAGSKGGLKKATKNAKPKFSIEDRKANFYNSLVSFLGQYPKDMIRAFYDYWSEKNPSGTKMRFELQKTWEVNKRLITWSNKEQVHGKSNSKEDSRNNLDALADRILAGNQS